MKRIFLPIAIDVSNAKILIIGGGQTALKKIKILQRSGVNPEVVAEKITPEIPALGITCRQKCYEKNDLAGCSMVYSCTNNEQLDEKIAAHAREAGVIVNVHDNPDLCQFVSPAIYHAGNISIAVSSNAENVQESIRIRNLIQNFIENQIINK